MNSEFVRHLQVCIKLPVGIAAKSNKNIRFMLFKPFCHGCNRNSGGRLEWISVDAHGYAAERNGTAIVFRRLVKAVPIAVR